MTQKIALWSIPISIAVLALKLLAWWLTGSVALLSDAMESTVNVVAALLAYFAVRIANIPPDENHPFGHKKAEYLSAVAEGVLIVLAAILIIREAVMALPNPHLEDAPVLGIAVNVIATGVNGAWAYLLLKTGRHEGSPALEASARHIFTDVMTSVGVIAGLILALATGWLILDPILAILVALNILWEGWKVIRSSVDGLMDVTLSDHDLQTVSNAIEANLGAALEYHDLKGRRSANVIFVEFHLVVDGTMPVSAAHDICNDIEEELDRLYPGSVFVIHLEPDDELKGDGVSSH
ncbi:MULTISPECIES: cation diffusion facilitator family transporter [unclassified Ruegeria]|uniref:cation diffusion facilitator family transporter n=1 Tax=unclassified Ruegeria TaxID=2625375 RepID=UPI001489F7A6|nr:MULTISPECIES: cation diffusion facilitator family transporter [unclassified Ruegeria]NOD76719.1 cation diffusion facilitator family transporter [Ruegeria sp. HKCCD4332]NOD88190.1 cation diffusion facilitator family transporter [Ruegeria sp. HKCCD4318]NOE13099.1 cation diffusion facilitator family transporter [Ruegeria sp. HKCCD4318-2]NOG11359.1 cation transporter [Ruegeria sp. HKCCD4315]